MLKLSEAVMLGSLVVTPQAGLLLLPYHDGTLHGCALGMACKAAGIDVFPDADQYSLNVICDNWPWTEGPWTVRAPCGCRFSVDNERSIASLIAHIFDFHVAGPAHPSQRWTLEQLVDWIREHEPQEEPIQAEPAIVNAEALLCP